MKKTAARKQSHATFPPLAALSIQPFTRVISNPCRQAKPHKALIWDRALRGKISHGLYGFLNLFMGHVKKVDGLTRLFALHRYLKSFFLFDTFLENFLHAIIL